MVRHAGKVVGSLVLAGLAGCQGLRAHAPTRIRPPELAVKGERDANGQLASQPKTKTVGVLAGQVVDIMNRRQPGAIIQVVPLEGGSAFLVNADENGYFVIQGLEPRKQYRLTGRAGTEEAKFGGTTFASPPNVVVLIKLNEKLGADAPPLEGLRTRDVPATPSAQGPRVKISDVTGEETPADRGPSPARLRSPSETEASQEPGAGIPVRPELLTQDDRLAAGPPTAQIRGPSLPGLSAAVAPPASAGNSRTRTNAMAVSLKELSGETTSLGKLGKKRTLVLLWSSSLPGGAEQLPWLAEIARQQPQLAVAAVAYEDGTSGEIVQRLRFQADRMRLSFPMLLGNGDACPLLRALDVRRLPALLLLDDQGTILWQGASADDEFRRIVSSKE